MMIVKEKVMFPFSAETGELFGYVYYTYPDDRGGKVKWSENYIF